MNRNEFLKLFKSNYLELNIEQKNINNHIHINLSILSKINNELNFFNLNEIRLIGFKPREKIFENNILKINVNEIYDHVIKEHNILGQNRTLYRVESNNDLGIYDAGGLYLFSEDIRKVKNDPYYDNKLKSIFDSMNDYESKRKYKGDWKFAFENLDDLIEWIGDKETYLNILNDSKGFRIKELTIPENMIIYGAKQAIYKKDSVRSEIKINFNYIEKNFLNKKNKLKHN